MECSLTIALQEQQDKCIRLLKTAEDMASGGHYAGLEARSRAYSVLEAATALHETCDTRTALLQQAILFFKLAQTVRASFSHQRHFLRNRLFINL